ncbi:hypothetical protein [Enterobacter hormaechei]|nr:hypothetical protein [Enterobacter hormaechei]
MLCLNLIYPEKFVKIKTERRQASCMTILWHVISPLAG